MRLVMVIPTYWGRAAGRQDGDSVYDHPTPLDQPGTLERTLVSLRTLLDHDFQLVVVIATTAAGLADQARRRVTEIISAASPPVPTFLFGQRTLARLGQRLGEEPAATLSLDGYGGVRNAGRERRGSPASTSTQTGRICCRSRPAPGKSTGARSRP